MGSEERADLVQRLSSARGHLSAVIKMVEREDSCELILHQLTAVQAALRVAATRLLDCQIRQSEEILLHDASFEERSKELALLRHLYSFTSQYPSHDNEGLAYERHDNEP